ncbi:MAG: OmpA family protein [Prevotella sp.]|nr:OmpA family protein [Prevotella sp.]
MKKIIHIAAAVALLFGVSTAALAQSVEDGYPYNFITVQGGAQGTFTNYDFTKLITPQVALSAGRYFNSKVGARLHVQGWQVKGALTDTYKFYALTGDLDLLMNMSNILCPNRTNDFFDWVLLAGFGVNYGWDFDEFNTQNNATKFVENPALCGTKHSSFNGRFGTQFNFNLSKNFALGLEVDANYKNDVFNLKRNFDPDWQLAAFLGATIKFGHPKKAAPVVYQEPVPEPVPEPKPEPKPEVKPEPKPKAAVVKDEPLKETFFYNIRLSDPDPEATLNKIASWCKKYPAKNIIIKGYADKGTGNPKINEGYAKARAEKVAKALQEKGIAADRMKVLSYGDTEQPFTDNDRNRCVIVVGE